ncbi:MAG: hypothetical protein ACON4E_07495 [Flavobacteriales bacterium]
MKKPLLKFTFFASFFLSVTSVQAQFFNTFETNSGSISLGPANPSFAHIYTDRPKFIFNEDVYSYKGGFSSHSIYDLFLKTNGNTRLTIDKDNGFVGIGTLNPTEKLDVVGSANIHHNLRVQQNVEVQGQLRIVNVPTSSLTDNVPLLVVGPSGQLNSISMADVQKQLYRTPCIEYVEGSSAFPPPVWSNHGGNNPTLYTGVGCPAKVAIGTDNPSAQLHVVGNAKVSLGLEVGFANNPNSKLEVHNDAIFDQRVAIGTDLQNGYDLAVCGNIRAGDVKVHAISDWCDYVFEDDYDLKSLEEVEAFIEQNKHLPEIPSAVEVETEGIQVSEMLQLMMKKIEELTLYSIEQDKRIKELEKAK